MQASSPSVDAHSDSSRERDGYPECVILGYHASRNAIRGTQEAAATPKGRSRGLDAPKAGKSHRSPERGQARWPTARRFHYARHECRLAPLAAPNFSVARPTLSLRRASLIRIKLAHHRWDSYAPVPFFNCRHRLKWSDYAWPEFPHCQDGDAARAGAAGQD